jgi:hypothetical protein
MDAVASPSPWLSSSSAGCGSAAAAAKHAAAGHHAGTRSPLLWAAIPLTWFFVPLPAATVIAALESQGYEAESDGNLLSFRRL